MTQVERMMTYQGDTEIAKEKMLQAESSLENYFRGPVHDIELGKQLIEAERCQAGIPQPHISLKSQWPFSSLACGNF